MKSPKPATENRFKKLFKSYLWNRTMLNFCSIVAAILKMETGRNFSMSGINSGRWNRTMLNLCDIVAAILKMETGRNFSMSGINSGRWNRTMLNLCDIVAAILKMATGRNFPMSGINSGHHNLSTYEMSLKLDNVEFVRYCGGHFENGDR
jgi:hypothetical protein